MRNEGSANSLGLTFSWVLLSSVLGVGTSVLGCNSVGRMFTYHIQNTKFNLQHHKAGHMTQACDHSTGGRGTASMAILDYVLNLRPTWTT